MSQLQNIKQYGYEKFIPPVKGKSFYYKNFLLNGVDYEIRVQELRSGIVIVLLFIANEKKCLLKSFESYSHSVESYLKTRDDNTCDVFTDAQYQIIADIYVHKRNQMRHTLAIQKHTKFMNQ